MYRIRFLNCLFTHRLQRWTYVYLYNHYMVVWEKCMANVNFFNSRKLIQGGSNFQIEVPYEEEYDQTSSENKSALRCTENVTIAIAS